LYFVCSVAIAVLWYAGISYLQGGGGGGGGAMFTWSELGCDCGNEYIRRHAYSPSQHLSFTCCIMTL